MPILEGSQRHEPQVAFVEENDVSLPSFSLRDFLSVLRRRKTIAINTFVLVVALGVVLTLMTKPVFMSNARIQVEARTNTLSVMSGNNDPLSSLFQPRNNPSVQTQVEILRSPAILNETYKQAQLPPGSVNLDVQRVDDTEVIELVGTSNSKDYVGKFIEFLPKVYQASTEKDRLGEVTSALDFAKKTLDNENNKLRVTEATLEKFRNSAGFINSSEEITAGISSQSEAEAELSKWRATIAGLQGLLSVLNSERRSINAFTESPVTNTNPQVQILKDKIAELEGEKKRLLFLYKPTDDEVRKVQLQIQDLQDRLAKTPGTVTNVSRAPNPAIDVLDSKIADARSSLKSAQNTLATVQGRVRSQNTKLRNFNSIEVRQAKLLRDQTQSTEAVNTLTGVVQQLTLRRTALEAEGSPVSILQPGSTPYQVAPSVSRNIILAVILATLLACAAALLQDSLDDHVRDEDEARRLLTAPVLGYFPQLMGSRQRPLLDLDQPDRVVLENFRALRTNVQFTLVSSPGRRLQVTSSLPSEGKSYVASNLAIAMALDGRKVILVDADLHRPRVHEIFEVGRQPGLTNILLGELSVSDALIDTGVPGLKLLSSGALPPNPVELLNSPAMDTVLEKLQEEADIVIFDSPPVLAAADGQVLASKMDGVLYVMQLGRVPRSALQRAMELLQQANAHIIGAVFNKVDEKQHQDTYGGYGNYYYGLEEGEGGSPSVAPSLTSVLGRIPNHDLNGASRDGDDDDEDSDDDYSENGVNSNGSAHRTIKHD